MLQQTQAYVLRCRLNQVGRWILFAACHHHLLLNFRVMKLFLSSLKKLRFCLLSEVKFVIFLNVSVIFLFNVRLMQSSVVKLRKP